MHIYTLIVIHRQNIFLIKKHLQKLVLWFFITIYDLKKVKYILILWSVCLCFIKANEAYCCCNTHMHFVNCIYIYSEINYV